MFSNEENMGQLWFRFIYDYWYAVVFWLGLVILMYYLYQLIKPKPIAFSSKWFYGISALVFMALFTGFSVIGMRGGYRHSTRPINMSNAGKYVNAPEEMAVVLNTPFCIARTARKSTFKYIDYFQNDTLLKQLYTPVHEPKVNNEFQNLNVVVIILESFSRENSGVLNPHLSNGNYKGYTPFLDSLINVSYSFGNAFANGRKSIDALPSILSSLPALVQPFVVSEYSSNNINGLGKLLREKKYHTSFFHGAPNGSMGFQAFTRMAGFDNYFGRDEYGNDADFDGIWGVWDEPFFQFFAKKLNTFPEPFVSSIFSVSSHHPYKVPDHYEGVFPKGTIPLHQCVGYTDMALRKFFKTASEMPWFNRTLFVITADHSIPGKYDEYNTSVNGFAVPLLLYMPGSNLKGSSTVLAQQTDIMPTVLNLLGYDNGFVAFGRDLLNPNSIGNAFVLNYANESFQFLMNNWAIYFNGKEVIAFYDIIADPSLSNNLKGKQAAPQSEVELMKAVIQQYNNRMIANKLTFSGK
jgi:phosphoglycerol transferase MdoB-like AlkP superfamily enzyme